MSELTPITRIESYLDAIVNSGIPPTENITRIETFLQAIYDNQVCALTPITRIEMFLGKISGQDIELPEPITRIELYLAAIAGEDVELPENPITRLEMYLAEWADSGDWTTISGAIVEFITQRAHKLKSCVVNLSPKQDLHGYDSPWPAGGGKNKLENLQTTQTISGVTFTVYPDGSVLVNGTASEIVVFTLNENLQDYLINGESYRLNGSPANQDPTKWKLRVYDISDYIDSGSGVLFTFNVQAQARKCDIVVYQGTTMSNVLFKPMIRLSSVADATFAPYENICPISGWTGVSVWDTGKNLFDKTTITDNAYVNGVGVIVSNTEFFCSDFISVKPETEYYIFTDINGRMDTIRFYNANKTVIGGSAYQKRVVTTPAKCAYIRINAIKSHISADEVFFNYPSSDTEYHAYSGNSYSVTFPPVNIWDEEWELGGLATTTGQPYASTSSIRSKNFSSVKPGTTYYIVQPTRVTGVYYYKTDGTFISYDLPPVAFTTPQDCGKIKLGFQAAYGTTYNHDISINYPSFETGYHAHTEPMTVYGGAVDVVSGNGKETEIKEVYDESIMWQTWGVDFITNGITGFYCYKQQNDLSVFKMCNVLPVVFSIWGGSAVGAWNNTNSPTSTYQMFCFANDALGIVAGDSNETAVAKLKAFLAVTPIVVSKQIPTPTDITTTPTPIATLKGYNAMWSNGGDIEVTVHGTPVEVSTQQALNMLLGGAYRNNGTADDVSDKEALDIILGGEQR